MADAPRNTERHEDPEPGQAREARRMRAVFRTTYEELGKMKRAEAVFGSLTKEQARAMLEDALWRTEQAAREAAGEEPET